MLLNSLAFSTSNIKFRNQKVKYTLSFVTTYKVLKASSTPWSLYSANHTAGNISLLPTDHSGHRVLSLTAGARAVAACCNVWRGLLLILGLHYFVPTSYKKIGINHLDSPFWANYCPFFIPRFPQNRDAPVCGWQPQLHTCVQFLERLEFLYQRLVLVLEHGHPALNTH